MDKEHIGVFRGKKVYLIPDKDIDIIILPESLKNYILKLQDIQTKYQQEQLKFFYK